MGAPFAISREGQRDRLEVLSRHSRVDASLIEWSCARSIGS